MAFTLFGLERVCPTSRGSKEATNAECAKCEISLDLCQGNSLERSGKNGAPFYGLRIVKLPSISLVSFSFPSTALPLVLQLNPSK